MEQKVEYHTCAFIDVLGYSSIVTSTKLKTLKKLQILESIYRNLQDSISFATIKPIQKINSNHKLFLKSFSDSVFIQSDNAYTVLFCIYRIFAIFFGHFANFTHEEHHRALLRAGIVIDWTHKILDISSLTRHPFGIMAENEDFQNLIGLGVARAYYTSEESHLSGMRIIISPEVLQSFELIPVNEVSFECYYIQESNLLIDSDIFEDVSKTNLFILPIRKNERGDIVNLYELCWPSYKSSNDYDCDIFTFIKEILLLESQYKIEEHKRHLIKTAELIYKSFEISRKFYKTEFTTDVDMLLKHLKLIAYGSEN